MSHIHELYDFVITVFIVHKNRVLFVHHPRYDKWLVIGGHIELHEHPEEALFREIKEESGLDVRILSEQQTVPVGDPNTTFLLPPRYLDVHYANPPHKHIGLSYFAVADNGNFEKSDEHTDMRWLTAEEIMDPSYAIEASIQFRAQEALRAARKN